MLVKQRNCAFVDSIPGSGGTYVRAIFLMGLLSLAVLSSAQDVSFKEYQLSGSPVPTSITAGPDGALWFTEYFGNKIGRITTTGTITEYPVAGVGSELSQLNTITAGPDGALWFTEGYAGKIGRITTEGSITEYAVLSGDRPGGITAGPDGALWFTSTHSGGIIGRITTTGVVTEYPLPPGHAPTDITLGPDGALWFTDLGANQIGRMTADGVLRAQFSLSPISCSCVVPAGIGAGPDGALWFAKDIDKIGRITTSGEVTVYPAPHYWPGHLTAGPDGALWFTEYESQSNAARGYIGRITTGGAITEYAVPTAYPYLGGLTLGPDRALWFTEQGPGKIGQLILPDTTPPLIIISATPTTLWPPNGKLLPVTVWGKIVDLGSGVDASSITYSVIDEYHQVQPRGSITLDAAGNYSFQVLLLASRKGSDKDGRQYLIQVSATDDAGNYAAKGQSVNVPHDRR